MPSLAASSSTLVTPYIRSNVECCGIDASFFGQLVEDRRLKGDFGQQEGIRLPPEGVEYHEARRHKLTIYVWNPLGWQGE